LKECNFHKMVKSQRSMMMNLLQEKRGDRCKHLIRIE
jgi:hypothetical protein